MSLVSYHDMIQDSTCPEHPPTGTSSDLSRITSRRCAVSPFPFSLEVSTHFRSPLRPSRVLWLQFVHIISIPRNERMRLYETWLLPGLVLHTREFPSTLAWTRHWDARPCPRLHIRVARRRLFVPKESASKAALLRRTPKKTLFCTGREHVFRAKKAPQRMVFLSHTFILNTPSS